MSKKQQLPSNEAINKKKQSFFDLMQQVSNGEKSLETKKDTIIDKLNIIKDGLLLIKDKNVPYKALALTIEKELGIKVSEQTLRSYCQNQLCFKKKERKKLEENKKDSNDSFKNALNENKQQETNGDITAKKMEAGHHDFK